MIALMLVFALVLALVLLPRLVLAQGAPSSHVLWASGSSFKGIWPVMRNGIVDAGFKNRLRVRYQAGQGAEASTRVLERWKKERNPPQGLLLAAAPYALRARIEQTLQTRAQLGTIPAVVLIGADTGSASQPRFVRAIVGIDAFATGVKAGKYALAQSARQGWGLGRAPTLCLRTRNDDPARARLCRGVAAGLGERTAMLTLAHKQRAGAINLKRLRRYLDKNPETPLIWLDDGAYTQEVLEVVKERSATSELKPLPLAVFGLARSQKVALETEPQRIAFIVDLRPFEQGRRAVALVREDLRTGRTGRSTGAAQVVSISARILRPQDLQDILHLIGRTR